MLVEGVNAKIAVHICYGNRYGKPSWEGSYRYLFPAILGAKVQQLSLEFARRGGEDLELFREFSPPFELGAGVIDVKDHAVETPDIVAERIRKTMKVVPAEKLYILPDCGLFHLPRDIAFAKLRAMVARHEDRPQGTGPVNGWREVFPATSGARQSGSCVTMWTSTAGASRKKRLMAFR